VIAPGHKLVAPAASGSHLAVTHPQLLVSSGGLLGSLSYLSLTGTSMATTVTSRVVAQIIEANRTAFPTGHPPLTPNVMKPVLMFSASTLRQADGIEYDRMTRGARAINAHGALALARAIDT
jgi:hypothetical protein